MTLKQYCEAEIAKMELEASKETNDVRYNYLMASIAALKAVEVARRRKVITNV